MKLVEVYTSVQGEGPNVGEPTTFIRFGGCNLRCPGWGEGELPDGTIVRGCDTIFAVYPEWRDSWADTSVDDILEQTPRGTRVCLTGGEPLLQRAVDMEELVVALMARGHPIDLFTNGTRILPKWTTSPAVTVVMDYKLPGSGEYGKFKMGNLEHLTYKDALKFVVKDRNDFKVAVEDLEALDPDCQIFFGPVWGEMDGGMLAEWIVEAGLDVQLNLQTHKYLWHPDERER